MNLRVKFHIAIFILALVSACERSVNLYDKPGFDEGTMPESQNPNFARVAPDYFYRQPTYPYPYPPQAAYTQPARPVGGSRFYSNPYAIPPSEGQYPYYDADQYYVPPTRYNNVESTQNIQAKPN